MRPPKITFFHSNVKCIFKKINFSLQVHDIVRGFVSIDGVTTSCFTGFLF